VSRIFGVKLDSQNICGAMTSFVEMAVWERSHDLGGFPWDEYIDALQSVVPMPVYDLSRILDASAVYDMARHAMYWNGYDDHPVHIPDPFANLMRAVHLSSPEQMQYFARALCAHISNYTLDVPKIRQPPTEHMDCIPVVPFENFDALFRATMGPAGLYNWLVDVIQHGSERSMRTRAKARIPCGTGRRKRKFCSTAAAQMIQDSVMVSIEQALESIAALGPTPRMWCTVANSGTRNLIIVLSARQRSPCDG